MNKTKPNPAIRVLILEDHPADAELAVRHLKQAGFEVDWRLADTQREYLAQLDPSLDVILSDYSMPQFDAPKALRLLQERGLDIPFIILSGTIGEERAAAITRQGAYDYLLKDRMARLGTAVRQAIENKRLREQLRQAQKMETVGQLAGGIAHDFNNVLTVIHGYTQTLITEELPRAEALAFLQQILQASERAGHLTRQLLTFSRKRVMQLKTIEIREVVTGVSSMLQRVIGEDVELCVECSQDRLAVCADTGMIEQVLMNLAVNARDAMPAGGRLAIATSKTKVDEAYVSDHPQARQGVFVLLRVSDTGCGIPPEILSRVFELFFTTKAPGKGTGLGLATVLSIAEQHHGWIDVESEVGRGTTFTLYLPSADQTAQAPSKPAVSVSSKPAGGHETILLVEDERGIRHLVATILRRHAYRVLEAESGEEALSLWQRHGAETDLVITDMMMPNGMTGAELVEDLWALKPKLKVIFTSGYCAESIRGDHDLEEGVNFLQKPYLPEHLAQTVRLCLDAQ